MPGIAKPAINAIPTGAPISVPTCHSSFFFLVHGFFPQNVQPVGLKQTKQIKSYVYSMYEVRFIAIASLVTFTGLHLSLKPCQKCGRT